VAVVGVAHRLDALMAARIAGAKRAVSVEVAERRIQLAKQAGADAVINPKVEDPFQRAKELTDGEASASCWSAWDSLRLLFWPGG